MNECMQARPSFLSYFHPSILVIGLLGMASGLPLALTAGTLSAWLKDAHTDIETIGLFTLVGLPYTLKFLWAPLMDGVRLPLLARMGRRRSWLLLIQLLLAAFLFVSSSIDPTQNLQLLALLIFSLAIASASQDIVIDAYRTEWLPPLQLGVGVTMTTLGYRIGMLLSGAGALVLAQKFSWSGAYAAMGVVMLGFAGFTLFLLKEPTISEAARAEADRPTLNFADWLHRHVVAPFQDFARQGDWWLILLFVITYKLGDAMLGGMTNPFLLELGFSKIQIAGIVKSFGLFPTLAGVMAVGWFTARYRLIVLLLVTGLFHAATNLMFLVQAQIGLGPEHFLNLGSISLTLGETILAIGTALENFTTALSAGVFVVFISRLCNAQYTATQYALLSALAAMGRTLLAASSGALVAHLGWEIFFALCVGLALPSLGILWALTRRGALAMLTTSPQDRLS